MGVIKDGGKPLDGLLDQRQVSQKPQQLFRVGKTALRPEPFSFAARHDYCIGTGILFLFHTNSSLNNFQLLPSFSMMEIIGMNNAITIPPTITARPTIMIGSIMDVSALTALSTSSS